MYMCVRIYIYIYIYTYTHTHAHTYTYTSLVSSEAEANLPNTGMLLDSTWEPMTHTNAYIHVYVYIYIYIYNIRCQGGNKCHSPEFLGFSFIWGFKS